MLRISALSAFYGDLQILDTISFTLGPRGRAGIVGPNGSGKTTLLRIIAGLQQPERGSVWLPPGVRLGYLRQGFLDEDRQSVGDLLARQTAIWDAERALDTAAGAPAGAWHEDGAARYQRALDRFEGLGGYAEMARVGDVLRSLALDRLDPSRPLATLSGGQRTRLALATLLIEAPGLLLLDEPTNHLDGEALRRLEDFVRDYRGAVLLVSHDRAFLDATVDTILELDRETHTITPYAGGYTAYATARAAAREAQWEQYRRQERERGRLDEDIRQTRERARRVDGLNQTDFAGQGRYAKGDARRRAGKVARKALVRERKLEKLFDDEHAVARPRAGWKLKLDFAPQSGGAREALRIEGLRAGYGERLVLDGLDLLVRHQERVVIGGPNGGGKSTLLRAIAGQVSPFEGRIVLGGGIVAGYFSQEQEGLDPAQTPLECVRAAAMVGESEARTMLHAYLFGGDAVFTPIGRLSYGERARLALARLVLSGANLLLLDEVTNHLDIDARERLEAALEGFTGTILAVLHDRYAIARLATRVLELREGRLAEPRDRR